MTVPTQAVKDPPSALSRRPSFLTGRYLEAEPELKRFGLLIYDSKGKKWKQSKIKQQAVLPVPLSVVFLFVYSLIICPIVFTFSLNIIPRACTIKRYVLAIKEKKKERMS